eukprot:CAMPEP_0116021798 /NCGR_PEP_ID=MMETSP0321-20121206/10603_1 /TAXON_ID=163516 /ORGANISM="Leptocylindrus danicus var. danicus, Strain B650" /LENGTH=556 /DNA_ID=CAMNT_0003492741 /DNA_START=2039 /DNA_END=3706 /DNA_ORIENTATION=-
MISQSPRQRPSKSLNLGGAGSLASLNVSKYSKRGRSNRLLTSIQCIMIVLGVLSLFLIYIQIKTIHSTSNYGAKLPDYELSEEVKSKSDGVGTDKESTEKVVVDERDASEATDPNCTFREYVDRRYYGHRNNFKAEPEPNFLKSGLYIRGKDPIILDAGSNNFAKKACLDHSAWDPGIAKGKRPFVDSQNPSAMSLRLTKGPTEQQPRLNKENVQVLVDTYGEEKLEEMFIMSATVGNGQCQWGETAAEMERLRISDVGKATTVHGELLILDKHLDRLSQTSIKLLSDADWGKKKKDDQMHLVELDDTRLFFFNGYIWLYYRNGGNLGYTVQAHNPLYIVKNSDGELTAFLKASEMVKLCCGRNMSIIASDDSSKEMEALTWVDPVTVTTFGPRGTNHRRLAEIGETIDVHRRLGQKGGGNKHKSDIHGTNGFMVHLPSTNEYLGVAHFHRPEGRGKNDYARHGHHYTHAYFTISDSAPYRLKRISNEFLFRSMSKIDGLKEDGDLIQFAGSIDLLGGEADGRLLISYGINDCEGAILPVDMTIVQKMLIDVDEGS